MSDARDMSATPENRRNAPRLAMQCPVSVLCKGSNGVWVDGHSVDISWKGICITVPVPCAVSETVTVSLPVFLDKQVHRQVSVRWRRYDAGMNCYTIGGEFL
ncbi:MAG: PilZ domain-containing protein [Spirochaetota bacterium]